MLGFSRADRFYYLMEAEAGVMERGGGRDSSRVGVGVGVGRNNKIGYVKKEIIKKRKWMRRIIKQAAAAVPIMPMPIQQQLQQLFDSCLDVFKGPATIPAPNDVHKLCTILGTLFLFSSFLFYLLDSSCLPICFG